MTKIIASLPLFQGLPEAQLADLARIARKQSYRKGQFLFSEGDQGSGFFVVLTGRVKVFKLSSEGKEQIFHLFERGEPVGEAAVFQGRDFPAHAVADSPCTVLFLPRAEFVALIRQDPSLALNMLAVLSARLRRFAGLVEDLSLKEVPGRLAAYLLHLSDLKGRADSLELDVTKGQLAAILGTIPETLSRILKRMNDQGLIRLQGSHIRILDRASLQEIAMEGKKL